ncbi:NAD(P)/FAD-dependent oxidoreductase [Sphingobium sp. CCH11-B1]|uniref:NAD(P)/FAD-dependent oxidoreductase n=1 Tax=Sphingobium sp. CCH11-B1 TaxID=1768781 RepID=UPI000831DE73|nr:NAD(P)/FAD-dependent oxidoreductase [Sphingobium sp. CCH11-B1]
MKHRVVIVGGGVAGLDLAGQLARSKQPELDVTLIDRESAHVWKPMLHTIAAGTADTFPNQTAYLVQARRRGFRFEPGEVVGVDRQSHEVEIALMVDGEGCELVPARKIAYDTLVLAAGSRANDFGTPGASEHCMTIDSRHEAIACNDHLRILMLKAIASGNTLSIAIVGAGATGVELASELIRLADILEQHGASGLRKGLKISLIESQSRILGPFPDKIAAAASEVLEDLGIDVLTHAPVQSADAQGFVLADGRRIDAELRIWAAGVRAPEFIAGIEGLEHSRLGQVVVGPTLMSAQDPAIFALGDCASLTLPDRTSPLPTTAQAAYQQSFYLGRQLPRMLNDYPVPAFRYHDFGSLVSLGGYDAYGTLGRFGLFRGGFLKGRVAQLGHALLYRRHQARLYGPVRGSLLWLADCVGGAIRPTQRLG